MPNRLAMKSLIGLSTASVLGVMTFMGNTIKENRETNVKEHTEIIKLNNDNVKDLSNQMHKGFKEQMTAQHTQYVDILKAVNK